MSQHQKQETTQLTMFRQEISPSFKYNFGRLLHQETRIGLLNYYKEFVYLPIRK